VEIITAAHAKPNPAWLNYVVTAKARHHIRHFLKTMQYEESAQLGERILVQALSALGTATRNVSAADWERLLKETGAKNKQEILAEIGLGKQLAIVIARKLLPPGSESKPAGSGGPVIIRGSEGMALQFARCCHPIPGDPIIGFIKTGRGMMIHTHDCPIVAKTRKDPEKWLEVEWAPDTKKLFSVNIKLVVSNQTGVLAKVAAEIAENGSNIENVSLEPGDSSAYTIIHFTLQVSNRLHLAQIMRGLRRLPEVIRINRLKG
jgi:GTP pyrophosphokinase